MILLVMDFGCVSSQGGVSPPHIFEHRLKLISDGYIEFLNTVVNLWFEDYMCGSHIQLAVIPPKRERSGCHIIFTTSPATKFVPHSPDCNPRDYYV